MSLKIIIDKTPDRERHAQDMVGRMVHRSMGIPIIPARDDAHVISHCYECGTKMWVVVAQEGRIVLCPRCEKPEQQQMEI